MVKKHIFILFFLTFILVLSCSTSDISINNSSSATIVILHTNDHHGHPLKFDFFPMTKVGGLPARQAIVDEIRAGYQNVLLLDAGDINTGSPESNFFKAEPDIMGYNYLKYDAVTLGNHEFDNGTQVLQQQIKQAAFPFLSANIKYKDGSYIGTPYIIKEFSAFKVAIFGLTTSEIVAIGNPDIVKNIIVEDEIDVAKKLVPELRQKADIIIALVHMGIYSVNTTGSRKLAAQVSGIDLIVDGHTHTQLKEPVYEGSYNTPIVQAWQWGLEIGKAVLTLQNGKTSLKWEAIPVNLTVKKTDGTVNLIGKEYKENEKLLSMLTPFSQKIEALLSASIGKAAALFEQKDVRLKETAIGNLVADSMLYYTKNFGVDFAISNAGGIRKEIPAGDITKKMIYEVSPFDNSLMILTLKGTDVEAMFDFIAGLPAGKGAFPVVSKGVSFTINTATKKCENIVINGKPFDNKKTYRIATNSFMAGGGDGYTMFKNALNAYDSSLFQRDVLINYIQSMKTITPSVEGRIKIIPVPVAFIWYLLRTA